MPPSQWKNNVLSTKDIRHRQYRHRIASRYFYLIYKSFTYIKYCLPFLTSYQIDVKSQFSFYLLIRLSSLFIIQQLTRKMMYRSVWYVLCYYKQKLFIGINSFVALHYIMLLFFLMMQECYVGSAGTC